MRKMLAATAAIIALVETSPLAAQSYNISYDYTLNGVSGIADQIFTVTAPANADGYFTITGLSGTFGGNPTTLLSEGNVGGNDNLFNPTASHGEYLDGSGVSFSEAGQDINVYDVGNAGSGSLDCNNGYCGSVSNFSAAAPEPASWAMMILGHAKGRTQNVTDTLHTVYAAGRKIEGEELADGAFGFVYRHWTLDL